MVSQLVQPVDAPVDRGEVGEQPTQPTMRDERHAHSGGFVANSVLTLFLRAHEQDRTAPTRDVASELVGTVEQLRGLLQVDDVNTARSAKMKGFILGFQRRVW